MFCALIEIYFILVMGQNPNTPIRIACMLKIYFQFLCAASHLNKGMAFFFSPGIACCSGCCLFVHFCALFHHFTFRSRRLRKCKQLQKFPPDPDDEYQLHRFIENEHNSPIFCFLWSSSANCRAQEMRFKKMESFAWQFHIVGH